MEKLVDDCIIMDYGSILVQMPVRRTARHASGDTTFTPGADVTIPAGDGLHRPTAIVNGRAELYSFDSAADGGRACSEQRGHRLQRPCAAKR